MSVEDDIRNQFSCSICLDTFKDPVTTECEHDFCRPCITEYWDREETSICPLCRQYSSGSLRTNRTLACVVEILQSKKGNSSEETDSGGDNNFGFLLLVILIFVIVLLWSLSPDASSLGLYPKDYDMCSQHKEKLKLFCEDDQELICLICRDSNKHKNHRVSPINEAARYYKLLIDCIQQLELQLDSLRSIHDTDSIRDRRFNGVVTPKDQAAGSWQELATTLESLKMTHIHHQVMKSNYEENLTLLMNEVSLTEQRIGKLFVRLHEFLRMEEESIVQDLHNDAWQRFTVLEEIIMQLAFESTALSDTIQAVSEDLFQEDAILFLMKLKTTQERVQMAISDPREVSVKMDGTKYKFLMMYNSWKKMVNEIGFNTVPLSLDAETAHRDLLIFNNMTNVMYSHGLKKPPDTSSRFSVHPFVLAQQGLSSGIHYWEIFVGCKTDWILGVTKESVERKTPISLTPQDGLWTLEKRNKHYVANAVPRVVIFSRLKSQKIGIYLDYEGGQVSFYNADYMNLMYTFKDTFTETLYPLFSPGFSFTPLRIIHREAYGLVNHTMVHVIVIAPDHTQLHVRRTSYKQSVQMGGGDGTGKLGSAGVGEQCGHSVLGCEGKPRDLSRTARSAPAPAGLSTLSPREIPSVLAPRHCQ
ncbi:E3 ubiquitin-protein ligase TRIM39-like [Pristis pectinata]|uniref:E3 ubiquitin-protein ligase TRIM39-like n=1 Tax=Pristis pectinata TaxID=685728 RepID=UPI00223D4592|nr:E3 ubiquitin-protein ligase TRIM39-like [Pristis pectinata]